MLSLPCPVLLSHEPNTNLQAIIGYPHGLFTLHSVSHLRARTFLETHCLFPTPVSRLHVMIILVSPGMADPPVLCRPHLLFLILMIRTLVTLEGAMPTPAKIGSREVLAGTCCASLGYFCSGDSGGCTRRCRPFVGCHPCTHCARGPYTVCHSCQCGRHERAHARGHPWTHTVCSPRQCYNCT